MARTAYFQPRFLGRTHAVDRRKEQRTNDPNLDYISKFSSCTEERKTKHMYKLFTTDAANGDGDRDRTTAAVPKKRASRKSIVVGRPFPNPSGTNCSCSLSAFLSSPLNKRQVGWVRKRHQSHRSNQRQPRPTARCSEVSTHPNPLSRPRPSVSSS